MRTQGAVIVRQKTGRDCGKAKKGNWSSRAKILVLDPNLALIDVRGWPVAPDPIDRHHIECRHCSKG